jgi:flavin reductase
MTDLSQPFRDAMRRMAATVNIITITDSNGVPQGMTATAVSSLSADPASLLVCVNQSASMHDSLGQASQFCVNVLHSEQLDLARTFSNSKLRDVRFASGGWTQDGDGPPYLPEAQASLICERTQVIAFATHSICIGTVLSIRVREDIDPLIYLDGRFLKGGVPLPA